MDLVAGPIGVVGLPLYSKVNRDEPETLESVYHNVMWVLVRIIFFSTTLLFVNFHDLTLILLGENWLPMVPIFKFMLVYSLLRPLFQNDAQLLVSLREIKLYRKITIVQALFMLVFCPILVFLIKANGAALASSAMMVLGFLIQNIYVGRIIKVNRKKLFLIPIIFLVIFIILMIFLVPKINTVDNILFRIFLNSVLVIVSFGTLFLLFERSNGRKVIIFLSDIVKEKLRK
jgi:O-antigen/teichoic acid export membrane protein